MSVCGCVWNKIHIPVDSFCLHFNCISSSSSSSASSSCSHNCYINIEVMRTIQIHSGRSLRGGWWILHPLLRYRRSYHSILTSKGVHICLLNSISILHKRNFIHKFKYEVILLFLQKRKLKQLHFVFPA